MKISELLNEKKKSDIHPIENCPDNLSWKLNLSRYKNLDPLLDVRRNKIYSMPFKNWSGTFYSLTLKDLTKIKFMPTEVLSISSNSLVGDMELINQAHNIRIGNLWDDNYEENQEKLRKILKQYEDSMVPMYRFVGNPKMFRYPEILSEPSQVTKTPYRVTTTDIVDHHESYYPVLGIVEK